MVNGNNLTLNKSKTELILIQWFKAKVKYFSLRDSRLLLSTVSPAIKRVVFTESLGVYIDENLTWNVRIEHISKKIVSCIGILTKSRSFVPFETLLHDVSIIR